MMCRRRVSQYSCGTYLGTCFGTYSWHLFLAPVFGTCFWHLFLGREGGAAPMDEDTGIQAMAEGGSMQSSGSSSDSGGCHAVNGNAGMSHVFLLLGLLIFGA